MEAGRNALGLSLRLARVTSGRVSRDDISAIEKAALELSALATMPQPIAESPLFATAEGLSLIIYACDSRLEQSAEHLTPIATDLQNFSRTITVPPDDNQKKSALRFRLFFERIHEIANEMVNFSDDFKVPYYR